MKILFDTNVIISGFVSQGYTFDVIKDAIFKHELYYTEYILNEVQKNLSKKFALSDKIITYIIHTIEKHFIKGKTAQSVEEVCRDPKDNQILADAVINNIEILITGDNDLLELKNYEGIQIILPKNYWKL